MLDGKIAANAPADQVPDAALGPGDTPGDAMFPGNTLPLEFDPRPQHLSAGLPTTDLGRQKSDLITVRVTDESVPDAGKERYALSLSIHGIERAGIEGGTRAAEDLITAFTTGLDDEPVVPDSVRPDAPTFAEVLRESIIYFTYPNPDGWRRGSISDGGFFFQRYNGNGVDLNRDWPDIGFSFRPYSGLSEPESRAFADSLTGIQEVTGSEFAGRRRPPRPAVRRRPLLHAAAARPPRLRQERAHPRHRDRDPPRLRGGAARGRRSCRRTTPRRAAGCRAPRPTVGDACAQIYGQTWGTVYDTINYTTTGALGDWFDSSVGLGADGIDNEMSFSHLDRNIVFEPHGEQLHVDGNKALIYAHLATILEPASSSLRAPPGSTATSPTSASTASEKDVPARPAAGHRRPGRHQRPDRDPRLGGLDRVPDHGQARPAARRRLAGRRQQRLQRRHAGRHHDTEPPGSRHRDRQPAGPVPRLRRAPGRRPRTTTG